MAKSACLSLCRDAARRAAASSSRTASAEVKADSETFAGGMTAVLNGDALIPLTLVV